MRLGFAAILAAFLVAACGPVMETRYDFVPPASEAGMQCVQSCQSQQTSCQKAEQDRIVACRQKADRDADIAFEKARDKYINDLKLHAAALITAPASSRTSAWPIIRCATAPAAARSMKARSASPCANDAGLKKPKNRRNPGIRGGLA